MAQVKIFGERGQLRRRRGRLSDSVHAAAMEVLGLPPEKRFHRFIGLEREDFIHSPDRSPAYTIIEISLFEGRSADIKRAFLKTLIVRVCEAAALAPIDLEITLFETPRSHWAIRGEIGDELTLPYPIDR